MDSVRTGLRDGSIEKDTYERLSCAECGEGLEMSYAEDSVGQVRVCPECGREWKDVR